MQGIVRGGNNDGLPNVKSVQRGTTTISETTTNVSITSIDTANSIVIFTVRIDTMGAFDYNSSLLPILKLTSATNLEISVGLYASTDVPIISWQVIEFNNVKKKQTGDATLTTASTDITISSVDINKTITFSSFKVSDANKSTNLAYGLLSNSLINATTLRLNKYTTINVNSNWQVIEFN